MNEPLHLSGLRGVLTRHAPLAKYTSWRAGGAADALYRPADRDDLAAFLRQLPADEPLSVLGLGSNTLVRDGGVRGTVVVMHNPGAALAVADGLIYADAGVACPKLARFAALHDRGEAEFLAGVPGTVGGALAMNAGCYGGETWRYVARVEVATRDGRFVVRTPDDYVIGYRSVRLRAAGPPQGARPPGGEERAALFGGETHPADGSPVDGIFTAAWFRFPEGDAAKARARIRELLGKRIATQPLSLPNAGSVFRNPPGDHAARLIEACGLKGHAIGGARVSEMHANFIVNPGGRAAAADIEALIEHVRATVHARTGILLEPEVRIVGVRA
ncbi:MAG: UDP-N-acetylmuramate dehydrogenase [Burkholderiales bacterium]